VTTTGGEPRIVIVGAGHSGGRAAEALRAAGFSGSILMLGAERYPPYERPPLSKELLAGSIEIEKTFVRPLAWYRENEITLRLSVSVTGLDTGARRVLIDGAGEAYDRLLLATGARPRRLRVPGGDSGRVHYIRDIADCLALRERLRPEARVAIIGAGFIGLEVAAVARTRGCAVKVIEMATQPLGRVVAPEIGAWFARLHRDRGVEVRTEAAIDAIEDTGSALRLRLAGGDAIEADLAVAGIGATPNTELAEAAGLAVQDGILVDAFGRSSDPAIFAAGDVTRHFNPILGRHIRLEAWQNAQNQAIAVAKVMAGGNEPFAEVPWFWTDQYDVNLQVAGAPERWDRLVWRGEPTARAFTLFYLEGGRVVAANTVNNARDMRFARMLIQSGKPVDAESLADPAVKLQDLAR
jgi:NADPH-dependent 2,4-dienoyl-CoA reductase/sulfur reductase-like enzyme